LNNQNSGNTSAKMEFTELIKIAYIIFLKNF